MSLIQLLQRRLGLDPLSIGTATLHHAIDEACAGLGLRDAVELLKRVQVSRRDWQYFVDCMVVPETWLFRVPEQFEDLVRFAKACSGRPLKILSLPCASGEEAYSMAASLLAAGFAPSSFQVLGIDVSERAIEQARTARYRSSALRGRELDLAWFEWCGECFSPLPITKSRVQFLVGNALTAEAFPEEVFFDVIFCRNLLIYLDGDARAQLLQRLLSVLAPDGLICAGQAEVLSLFDARLEPAPGYGPLSFVRATPATQVTAPPALPLARMQRPGASVLISEAARYPVRSRQENAATNPAMGSVKPRSGWQQAQHDADSGDLTRAHDECVRLLAVEPESVQGWFLLGNIELARGALEEADAAFARVSYLEPFNQEAARHRLSLAERLGRHAEATQLRARWQRLNGERVS
jgi:chemotaxis protein methyltransferase WspC